MIPSYVTKQQIEQRAYQLWLDRGCPLWESEQDWLDAETQLRAEARQRQRRLLAHVHHHLRNLMVGLPRLIMQFKPAVG